MKNIKKMMAIVLAMVMVLMYSVPVAFGANTAKTLDPSISVTGLEEGDVVNFYKVVEWDQNSGWKFTSAFEGLETDGLKEGTVVGWDGPDPDPNTIKDDVLKYIAGIPGDATITENDGQPSTTYVPSVKGRINSELAAVIATIAVGEAADHQETVASGATSVVWQEVKEGETVTKAAPEAGLYLALVTPKTAGVTYNPIFVSADYDETNADGHSNVQEAVADPSLSYSDNAMAKKTTIDVKKTINSDPDEGDPEAGSTGEGDTATSVDTGEIVQFKVTTTIPEYSNMYEGAAFTITDTLTGLKLVIDANHKFEIKAAGTKISTDAGAPDNKNTGNFTNSAVTEGTSYVIDFASDYLLEKISATTPIEITYWAQVTGDNSQVINPTDNTVKVEFSNNPNNLDDKGTVKDRTNQYSFSIDADINGQTNKTSSELIKIGVDKDGNPLTEKITLENGVEDVPALAGATFALLTSNANINSLLGKSKDELLAYNGTGASDIYSNIVNGATVKAVTDSSDRGKLNFKGLDAGTYYLVETKAPDGFIRDTTVYTIEIAPTYEEQTITEKINGIDVTYKANVLETYSVTVTPDGGAPVTSVYEPILDTPEDQNITGSMSFTNITNHIDETDTVTYSQDADHTTLLVNKQGVELPSTGGIGTTLFYIIGLILVVGAGVLLVTKRRMKKFEQ